MGGDVYQEHEIRCTKTPRGKNSKHWLLAYKNQCFCALTVPAMGASSC